MAAETQTFTRPTSEEIVSWTIDFIFMDLKELDAVELLKLKLDLAKNLLWYNAVTGDYPDYDLKHVQSALKETFRDYLIPVFDGKTLDSPAYKHPSKSIAYERKRNGTIDKVEFTNWTKYKWPRRAVIRFHQEFESILPIPADALRICIGCGKYFFSVGKGARSTRRYCSRKCNLRHTDKLRREKNLEAYNKKQREIMRKRYAKVKGEK